MRRWVLVLLVSPACVHGQAQAPTSGNITGTVVNEAIGKPVAGARVKLSTPNGEAEPVYARTDPEGRFEFVSLNPGGYLLYAESPGLEPAAVGCGCVRMELKPGDAVATTTIPLRPYAVIYGKLTDFNGIPVANSPIEILMKVPSSSPAARLQESRAMSGQDDVTARGGATTNDRGEFRVAHIAPGAYYVVANKHLGGQGMWQDLANHITYFPHALDLASAKPIEVATGQQVRADIQIVRQEGVRIAGRLLKAGSETSSAGPYSYTSVTLVPEQNALLNPNGPHAISRSDRFELVDVSPGKYKLVALTSDQSDPWGADRRIVFTAVQHIEVANRDVEGLDIQLQPVRALQGAVAFPEGCASVPVRIQAYGAGPVGSWREVVTGGDGKFVLDGFAPTRYRLEISTVPSAGGIAAVASATMGSRDVLKDGFDYPFDGDAVLRIVMRCANGRPQ